MMASVAHKGACGPPPPGLSTNDSETATVSRERRRVALAAKAAVGAISAGLLERTLSLEVKLDRVLDWLAVAQRETEMSNGFKEIDQHKVDSNFDARFNVLEATLKRIEEKFGGVPLLRRCDVEELVDSEATADYYGTSVQNAGTQTGEGDYVGSWLPLASLASDPVKSGRGQRQLRVNISDTSTAATEGGTSETMQPLQTSWQRLAECAPAHSQLAHTRAMVAAPASVGAIVSRWRRCSDSCSPRESDSLSEEEEDFREDPALNDFIEAIVTSFTEASLDVASKKDSAKHHLAIFVRARISNGESKTRAFADGLVVIKGTMAAMKEQKQ